MGRKTINVVLVSLALWSISYAEAQQAKKVTMIGFLGSRPVSDTTGVRNVFEYVRRILLDDLGYVEGKNIAFEYRHADNKLDRLPALADELVRLKVDLFVTPGINEALAAKNATRTIPIVFSSGADPVAAGLVDSLARPGGNVTGFTYIAAVLSGAAQGNHSQTLPRRSTLESTRSRFHTAMERKPTIGTRTGSATSFHGGQQRRQIRGCIRSGN